MPALLDPPKTRHSRAEYRSLPEGPPYFELIAGEFIDMPRPGQPHADVGTELIYLLRGHSRVQGGYVTYEPNLYLPGTEDVLHPDLVYLTAGNVDCTRPDGIYGVPDLVIEILSPGTERKDRTVKRRIYQRAGVPNLWLVDPEEPVMVETFELDPSGEYRLTAAVQAPDTWRHPLFPGVELSLPLK